MAGSSHPPRHGVTFSLESNEAHPITYTLNDIRNAWLSPTEQGGIRRNAALTIKAYRLQNPPPVRVVSSQQDPHQQDLQQQHPTTPRNDNITIDMRGLEHHSTPENNKNKIHQGSTARKAILAAPNAAARAQLSIRWSRVDVEHAIQVAAVDATTAKIIQSQPIDSTAEADIRPCKTLYSSNHQKLGSMVLMNHQHQQPSNNNNRAGLVYYSLFSRRRRAPRLSTSKLPLPAALAYNNQRPPPNLSSVLGEALELQLQFPGLHQQHQQEQHREG